MYVGYQTIMIHLNVALKINAFFYLIIIATLIFIITLSRCMCPE